MRASGGVASTVFLPGRTRGGGMRKSKAGNCGVSSQLAKASSSIAVKPPGAAREGQFGRRGLRDLGNGAAERRTKTIQPFGGGGLSIELPVPRQQKHELA